MPKGADRAVCGRSELPSAPACVRQSWNSVLVTGLKNDAGPPGRRSRFSRASAGRPGVEVTVWPEHPSFTAPRSPALALPPPLGPPQTIPTRRANWPGLSVCPSHHFRLPHSTSCSPVSACTPAHTPHFLYHSDFSEPARKRNIPTGKRPLSPRQRGHPQASRGRRGASCFLRSRWRAGGALRSPLTRTGGGGRGSAAFARLDHHV